MLLWIGFAVLTALVVGALALPYREGWRDALPAADADAAVYRDQLAEIAADRERGLIGEEEAVNARTEVARRLLKSAADTKASGHAHRITARSTSLIRAVLVSVPALSIAVYLTVGSPLLPGQPLASRGVAQVENASVEELLGKVEARLREHPEDGRGWEVIAPVYLRMGRGADAAHAYSQSIRLNGESVKRLIGFAEATLLAGNGVVSEEAKRAAERILVLEPERIEPRVWLALGKEQDGDLRGAAADYRALLAAAAGEAPWRKAVEERLATVEARLDGRSPPARTDEPQAPAAEGAGATRDADPAAAAAEAVSKMSPDEQKAFIEAMVARLAERLKADGKDLEGWEQLVRSYLAMGRTQDATAALGEARRSFSGDKSAEEKLDALARNLGLGS